MRSIPGRLALGAAALLAGGGLAMAGSLAVSASGPGLPSQLGSGHLRLELVRASAGFPGNHLGFAIPARVTSDRAGAIRRLARVIAAMPAVTPGIRFCPIDFGVQYRLEFRSGTRLVASFEFDPGGCMTLESLPRHDHPRQIGGSFWPALGAAIGVSSARLVDFAGNFPAPG